jgi:hypothetical protein
LVLNKSQFYSMTAGSEQLQDISRQIQERFTSHNLISVLPTRGAPPDQYEVTYMIPGMTQIDGEVVNATSHVIELSLPFGFPQFPPSCKPKSIIFHPDFDLVAICLGDLWEQDRSLPDLIIHIGRMISGEFFSAENAFNEEAAKWFVAHQDELPFSTALADRAAQDETSGDQPQADIHNDPTLSADVEYLFTDHPELDEDVSINKLSPPIEPDSAINISSLQILHEQKKHFELVNTIKTLSFSSEEIDKLLSSAEHAINEANKYNKIAQEKEQKGNVDLALKGYIKVAGITADFPDISSSIDRSAKSLAMLKNVVTEILSRQKTKATSNDKLDRLDPTSPEKRQRDTDSRLSTPAATHDPDLTTPQKKWSSKLKFFILFWILLHAGGTGAYFYIKDQINTMTSAEQSYNLCRAKLEADRFKAARDSCDNALQLSENVIFSQQQAAQELTAKIQTILQSEKLQQGLTGRTLINGQYLLQVEAETLVYFDRVKTEGADFIARSQWSAAAERLNEAIDIAEKSSFIKADTVTNLTSKLQYVKLQTDMAVAAAHLDQKAWQEAIAGYTATLTYLKSFPAEIQHRYENQLQQKLAVSRFEDQKQKADNLFAGSEWLEAISAYQRVLTLGRMSNSVSGETLSEIATNINQAKLYHTIISGHMAFNSGSWDEAIRAYKTAQSLLASSERLRPQTTSDVNIRQLEKIILQTSSIKNRKTANKFTEEKDLPAAKLTHEKIIHDIAASPFSNDSDFMRIKKESSEIIAELSRDIFLNEKRHYLETNYQKLFPQHFPSVSPEDLTNPVITVVKESLKTLLFKIQCRESGSGHPLSLIMYYAYDKKGGTWKFSSGIL